MALVIAGCILISLTKPENDDLLDPESGDVISQASKNGTWRAVFYLVLTTICFGVRGILFKYMAVRRQISSLPASNIILLTDGIIGTFA